MIRSFILCCVFCVLCTTGSKASPLDELPSHLDRSDSLSGYDENKNGIRDDIDAWLKELGYNGAQLKAVEQLARSLQKAVTLDPVTRDKAKKISERNTRAIACVFERFQSPDPALPGTISRKLESLTTNTKARLKNYLAYNKALDGTVSALPDGNGCE